MIVKRLSIAGALAALAFGAAGVANAAPVTIAGATYDSAAAADGVTVLSGSIQLYDIASTGVTTANGAIGGSVGDGLRCAVGGCSFEVFFEGGVQNQQGSDIVLYGVGVGGREPFDISYGDVQLSDLVMTGTGSYLNRYQISALYLDLSDLGVAIGAIINTITITVKYGPDSEEFAALYSLNTDENTLVNPIPAAAWLFGTALLGGGFVARKRKRS
jgi:hypothetical protein